MKNLDNATIEKILNEGATVKNGAIIVFSFDSDEFMLEARVNWEQEVLDEESLSCWKESDEVELTSEQKDMIFHNLLEFNTAEVAAEIKAIEDSKFYEI